MTTKMPPSLAAGEYCFYFKDVLFMVTFLCFLMGFSFGVVLLPYSTRFITKYAHRECHSRDKR